MPAACRTADSRPVSRRCRRCGLNPAGRPTCGFSSSEEIWEYATGPEGIETYVVVFDGNDLVRSAQQVLTEDNIHRLIPRKTTREETRNLLGRPGDVYQGERKRSLGMALQSAGIRAGNPGGLLRRRRPSKQSDSGAGVLWWRPHGQKVSRPDGDGVGRTGEYVVTPRGKFLAMKKETSCVQA